MLTDEEMNEIEEARGHYADARGAIPDALKAVQRRHGWVSDAHVVDLAGVLGLTADEIDSVATFYSLIYRREVGRHVILLCDSVSCWITGYEDIRQHLSTKLGIDFGQTTADGRFTLLPVVCLGACEQAPVMMVDEQLHGNLTAQKVDEVLARYL